MKLSRKIGIAMTALIIALLPLWRSDGVPSQSTARDTPAVGKDHPASRTGLLQAPEEVELTAAVAMEPEEYRVLTELNGQYMELAPGVTVKLEQMKGDPHTEWLKQAAMGTAPDIMLLDTEWVQHFASRGVLQPVDLARQSTDGGGPWWASVRWNGYDWAMPKDVDPYVWAYKPAVTVSTSGYGQQQVGGNAMILTADWLKLLQTDPGKLPGRQPVYFEAKDAKALPAFLWSLGAVWEPVEPKPATAADAAAAGSIQASQLLDLYIAGGAGAAVPASGSEAADNPNDSDEQDRDDSLPVAVQSSDGLNRPEGSSGVDAATRLNGGDAEAVLMRYSDFKRLAGPGWQWSVPEDGRGALLAGRSFAVSASSPHGQAAAAWIRYMISGEAAIKLWQTENKYPIGPMAYRPLSSGAEVDERRLATVVSRGRMLPPHPELPARLNRLRQMAVAYLPGGGAEGDSGQQRPNGKDWLADAAKAWTDETGRPAGRAADRGRSSSAGRTAPDPALG